MFKFILSSQQEKFFNFYGNNYTVDNNYIDNNYTIL